MDHGTVSQNIRGKTVPELVYCALLKELLDFSERATEFKMYVLRYHVITNILACIADVKKRCEYLFPEKPSSPSSLQPSVSSPPDPVQREAASRMRNDKYVETHYSGSDPLTSSFFTTAVTWTLLQTFITTVLH